MRIRHASPRIEDGYAGIEDSRPRIKDAPIGMKDPGLGTQDTARCANRRNGLASRLGSLNLDWELATGLPAMGKPCLLTTLAGDSAAYFYARQRVFPDYRPNHETG